MSEVCYHCGLPIPANPDDLSVSIDGRPRAMCCAGCQAVAQAIVDNGLASYYRHRDAMPESPREAVPAELADFGLFDHPDFQKSFVRPAGEGEREADLILEGITCAACVWLNERHLAGQRGIVAVQVNYATRRARVRWRETEIKLSGILAAVAAIGYRAHPYDPARSEAVAQRERKTALWRLLVAGFGMMQVMMYAYPAYIAGPGDMTPAVQALMRWASLLLTLPVVCYSAAPFFQRAWRDLRLRRLGMDMPVALGIGSAFLASLWATFSGQGDVYFDSVTMFVFFLLGGRYLEMLARQRAVRGTEALGKLVPVFARRVDAAGGETRVPSSELLAGDRVRVLPGEGIVVDGVVRDGRSDVDESWLTGESRPQARSAGDEVLAGSINRGSPLLIEARNVGESTRLATLRNLMERAAAERPRIVQQADRVAGWFIAALLLIACATGAYWWQADASRALWIFVSVLVVSCPCALSLATPVALTVASEAFARAGLLVTRGHAIETLARAGHFVFDKTGTLTYGRMQLTGVRCAPGIRDDDVIARAAALERHSEHAIAQAIVAAAPSASVSASDVQAISGQGVTGRIEGVRHAIGRAEFVAMLAGCACPPALADATGSEVLLAREGQWLAALQVDDALRPEAKEVVASLQAEAALSLFSGDAAQPVAAVAHAVGIDDARAGLTPEGKHAALLAMQADGALIAMVGDGVNDAPVLAQAHVSVAMAGGTELARNHADIVLLRDDLRSLVSGRRLARRTLAIIRQNLAWAFAYNLLAVPAAMAGWVTPLIAGVGMGASSLLVVLNALRIGRGTPRGHR